MTFGPLTPRPTDALPTLPTRLVLFAHGSRDPHWRQPFERLLATLQAECGASAVTLAYMEMAEPTLGQRISDAVAEGIERVVVLPLFMASGGHLRHDVPLQLRQARDNHPQLTIELMPPVGEHPLVIQAIGEIARLSLQVTDNV